MFPLRPVRVPVSRGPRGYFLLKTFPRPGPTDTPGILFFSMFPGPLSHQSHHYTGRGVRISRKKRGRRWKDTELALFQDPHQGTVTHSPTEQKKREGEKAV